MRNKIIIGLAGLVVMVIAIVWLLPAKPRAGPWKLADGSELSLAGVTYGSKHTMRYGSRLVDYLYPVLPEVLRKKFGCKVVSVNTQSSNAIVVWIWTKGVPLASVTSVSHPHLTMVAVDKDGSESEEVMDSYSSVRWHGTNVLEGWRLKHFPHRGKEMGIRIFSVNGDYQRDSLAAEFSIPNRLKERPSEWKAQPLPITINTNSLECSLIKLETGLTNVEKQSGIAQEVYSMVSRALFEVRAGTQLSRDWTIHQVKATSASGEIIDENEGTYDPAVGAWVTGRIPIYFAGPLWRDEPAWKLGVELSRIAKFPTNELWTVIGLKIPAKGRESLKAGTNFDGSEIELVEIARTPLDEYYSETTITIRSPLPEGGRHLRLVDVTDDEGEKIKPIASRFTDSTSGRGATIKERDTTFVMFVPIDAKSVDVTLAYSKSIFVEFLAPADGGEGRAAVMGSPGFGLRRKGKGRCSPPARRTSGESDWEFNE